MENLLSTKITDRLYYIGVNDRYTSDFEGMWPLPNGIAYNSYIIKGSKNILMDTVKIDSVGEYEAKVKEVLADEKIDYVVVHHMEPDHSSSLLSILERYPQAQIVTNAKAVPFLKTYYGIEDNIIIVKEGETLELGDTKLTFFMTPMVHWPESMVSYEAQTKTLFSQDIFGAFGTLDGSIFDDELDIDEFYIDEARRYFINIVGKYAKQAASALKKLEPVEISMICSVHGPIWRKNPKKVYDLYVDLANQKTEDGVLIIYGSMYGNTERMAEAVAKGVSEAGISNVRLRDLRKTSNSYLLADAWKYKGVILGSCAYDNGLYPLMEFFLTDLKHQKMKNNIWGLFGSYSWSGGGLKGLQKFAEEQKYKVLPLQPDIQGAANEEDLKQLIQLGRDIANAVKEAD